jgi:hypothetical protein
MTPNQIEIFLRLYSHVDPFEGYTDARKFAPDILETFNLFHQHGLIQPWVEIDLSWRNVKEPLTIKGLGLIRRLMAVQP